MYINYLCLYYFYNHKGFPGGSVGKESACNMGDLGSSPGLGRSPGEGIGKPLHTGVEIPWTGEPGWLQSMESQESDMI